MEVEWRKLRADELRAAAKQDAIVILPVASIEQHGPRALVLPVLWTGLSEHHMPFGGTITLGLPAFAAVIEDICRSIGRHGFRRIGLSNSHGGNENALKTITDELTIKLRIPIVHFTYVYGAATQIAGLLTTQTGIRHACEGETAMMLALRPELVAKERIPARSNTPSESGAGVHRWRSFAVRTETGVIGNPDAATAEQGQKMLAAIAEALAEKLADPALWEAAIFP